MATSLQAFMNLENTMLSQKKPVTKTMLYDFIHMK